MKKTIYSEELDSLNDIFYKEILTSLEYEKDVQIHEIPDSVWVNSRGNKELGEIAKKNRLARVELNTKAMEDGVGWRANVNWPDEIVERYMGERAQSRQNFRIASEPLLKYLNENHHPHVTAIITPTSIELVEGKMVEKDIFDFVVD